MESSRSMPNARRVLFANQLRGIAALSVLLMHFTVVVQLVRPAVAWVVAAPVLDGPVSPAALWLSGLPVDPAATGVGLFFLISGFVIPYSLEKSTPILFLLSRAARIFPTFWAALLLEWFVVRLSGTYWHRASPFVWQDYWQNGLLLSTITGRGSVDWVSWTLSIEFKFYVVAAIFGPLLRSRIVLFPVMLAVFALMMNIATEQGLVDLPPRLVGESTYIAFIMIGWLFHNALVRRITLAKLVPAIVAVMVLVLLCWKFGPLAGEFKGRSRSLLAALAVFSICYAFRDRFRPSASLDRLAAISYPLYLIHSVVGFTIVTFICNAGHVPYPGSVLAAMTACVVLAGALHVAIEKPTMGVGHRIAAWRASRNTARTETVATSRPVE